MQVDLCHCCSQTSEDRFSSVGANIMGCPPVCGDNPQALASGLSYVQGEKHGITILYHPHECRPCTSGDISC